MATLGSTTQSLRLKLGAAHATLPLKWGFSYGKRTDSTGVYLPQATANGTTNGTTVVTAIAAPASGTEYAVARGTVTNEDSIEQTLTVFLDDAGVQTPLKTVRLQPGDNLHYMGDGHWEVQDEEGSIKTGVVGPAGPAGDPTDNTFQLSFSYGDATPEFIGTAPAGKLIETVRIYITQAFNGTSPSLTIGDAGDTDRLMAAVQNNPAAIGMYESFPIHSYGGATAVNLYIVPGAGATTGAGLVVITYQF
jgi:hypothetical protein